jgi:hypothetical protein
MSLSPREQELVDRYVDRTATADDVAELESLIVANPEIANLLVNVSQLEALLGERLNASRRQSEVDALMARLNSPAPPSTIPFAISMARGLRINRYATAAAILIVAAIFYGTFTLLAWNLNRGRHVDADPVFTETAALVPTNDYVATLITATDCRWDSTNLTAGSRLAAGKLRLEAGHAEIEFNDGATVHLDGPCQFDLASTGGGHVQSGKLWAIVPQRAAGFTITTPSATVVDLGTEFSVEVNDAGATDVQVTKGNVELHPGRQTSPNSTQPAIPLSAGAARRIEINAAGEATVREIAQTPQRFSPATKSTRSIRLPVVGAMASSEHGVTRQANNLINGSGMRGEGHTNCADNNMWHTTWNHVKNEFVLIDLGRPCQLESMKVWNYNEAHMASTKDARGTLYEVRGAEQVDIFASTTGKGDPLSHPKHWQLVAEDQKLTMADGSDQLKPDVVSLGDVKARYVAIVVEARHHPERKESPGECVGLSEVQFFGKVIHGAKPSGSN